MSQYRIDKVKGAGGYDYWIVSNGNIIGRAKRDGRKWYAATTKGNLDMWHDKGVEVTAATLAALLDSLADAARHIEAERINRARQDRMANQTGGMV